MARVKVASGWWDLSYRAEGRRDCRELVALFLSGAYAECPYWGRMLTMMKGVKRNALLALIILGASVTPALATECVQVPTTFPLLSHSDAIFSGTVTEHLKSGARFLVTEAFKGAKTKYVDVIEQNVSFENGQQYVVFAHIFRDGNGQFLWTTMCDGDRLLRNAQGTVEQLRAERNGRHAASVYGMATLESGIAMEDSYYRPLANVTVRLRSGTRSYETKTDRFGAYAFWTLPPGAYDVSADLPPNLEQGQIYGYPALTFELPPRSSWEQNVYAFPKGRIIGKVKGPDGEPLRSTSVELLYAKQYQEGKQGLYAYQGERRIGEEWRPFEYEHLPAGDYVVVFNRAQQENPDAPFQRTSRFVHLDDGQQLMDADIHLSSPRPTRKITVRRGQPVSGADSHYPPMVVVEASAGVPPFPYLDGEGTYTLNLLLNSEYTIHAEAFCLTKGKLVTNSVTVKGSDLSVSEVNLVFEQHRCGGE